MHIYIKLIYKVHTKTWRHLLILHALFNTQALQSALHSAWSNYVNTVMKLSGGVLGQCSIIVYMGQCRTNGLSTVLSGT